MGGGGGGGAPGARRAWGAPAWVRYWKKGAEIGNAVKLFIFFLFCVYFLQCDAIFFLHFVLHLHLCISSLFLRFLHCKMELLAYQKEQMAQILDISAYEPRSVKIKDSKAWIRLSKWSPVTRCRYHSANSDKMRCKSGNAIERCDGCGVNNIDRSATVHCPNTVLIHRTCAGSAAMFIAETETKNSKSLRSATAIS